MTFSSRGVRVLSSASVCSFRLMLMTASDGADHVAVLDEVPQMRVLLLADRRLQRDRLLGDLQDLAHLADRDVHPLRRSPPSVGSRPSSCTRRARGADQLVDGLDHVHRDADGAGLVGDGAGDGLADPPRGVGRELVAALVLELVHRLHQADVALLDQVQELQAAVRVLLGDRDHQAQVGLDQLLLGLLGLVLALDDRAERALQLVGAGVELLLDLRAAGRFCSWICLRTIFLYSSETLAPQLRLELGDLVLGLADALHRLADALGQAALHRLG